MSDKSSLYTKTGDQGETSVLGKRLKKSHPRLAAIGSIDELNASLGVAISQTKNKTIRAFTDRIQNELFNIGAELANPDKLKLKDVSPLEVESINFLEDVIDNLDALVKPLRNFILPAGTPAAASFHFSRTICRRAERKLVLLSETEELNRNLLKYINRLSDLLFVTARYLNKESGIGDRDWQKS